jgi:hypothetical protein
MWLLFIKRIMRPKTRVLEIRGRGAVGTVRIEVPSSSIFNFIFEAGWIALGIWFMLPPRVNVDLSFGLVLVIIPGFLSVARALRWRERATIG